MAMGLYHVILQGCGAAACLLVAFGLVRFVRAVRMNRLRRIDADYRAADLLQAHLLARELRAGERRAAEREWGRTA